MNRKRSVLLVVSVVLAVLALAPAAFATTHGGQGIYGPTNYKTVTDAMFIIIGLFPVLIIVFSVIQGWLEHRKHERVDAAKRRAASAEWKGGW